MLGSEISACVNGRLSLPNHFTPFDLNFKHLSLQNLDFKLRLLLLTGLGKHVWPKVDFIIGHHIMDTGASSAKGPSQKRSRRTNRLGHNPSISRHILSCMLLNNGWLCFRRLRWKISLSRPTNFFQKVKKERRSWIHRLKADIGKLGLHAIGLPAMLFYGFPGGLLRHHPRYLVGKTRKSLLNIWPLSIRRIPIIISEVGPTNRWSQIPFSPWLETFDDSYSVSSRVTALSLGVYSTMRL